MCNEHSDCRPSSSHVARPKRLLQISFQEDCPRVNLVGGEDEPHARYTALSHCWGTPSSVFKTFKGTVDDNKEKGVSVSGLPKTFQDAIDITWKLGIRHIWIDSMCIVQCDQKEWEVECTKMGDVYGGAYLVIAASMAENSSVGCYKGRESHLIKFSLSSRDTDTVDLHVKEKVDHKIWRNDEPSWQDWQCSKLPLLSRAWAIQERLLAVRTIHYTSGELVWECRSSVWCECGDLKDGHDSFFRAPGFKIRYARTVRYGSDNERLMLWFALINQYQARELSFPSDRIPALSAIAKQVNSSGIMGTYVCGVWTQWLRQSLFWWSEYDRGASESRKQRPHKRNPQIPTWSWLSIQGHINTWGRDPNAVVLVTGFEVPEDEVPEDVNASSSYSSAKIGLRGFLCMVELTAIEEPAEEKNFKIRRAGDEELEKSARLMPDTIDDFEVPLEELSYRTFYVLRYSPITISFRDQPEYWNCLVLISSKSEIDVFRRIGIAEIKHDWFRNCVDRDITLV